MSQQPSCVPNPDGSGAFRPTPVPHVLDDLRFARCGRRLVEDLRCAGARRPSGADRRGYGWSICPSFAGCLYTPQVNNLVPTADVLTDAAHGHLPNYSVLTPSWSSRQANGGADTSQHNSNSMLAGDNWIGRSSPRSRTARTGRRRRSSSPTTTAAASTTTSPRPQPGRDSAGPAGADGDRQPVRQGRYTDSTDATFASILAFTEHTFGLAPLAANDAAAYDYANSFDYTQAPLPGAPLTSHPLPPSTVAYLQATRTMPTTTM